METKQQQEQLIKKFNDLKHILINTPEEKVLRYAVEEVFNDNRDTEPSEIKPVQRPLAPHVGTLRAQREKLGISQKTASKGIGKLSDWVGRLENGKIKKLDKVTEKKLLEFYKKKEEELKNIENGI